MFSLSAAAFESFLAALSLRFVLNSSDYIGALSALKTRTQIVARTALAKVLIARDQSQPPSFLISVCPALSVAGETDLAIQIDLTRKVSSFSSIFIRPGDRSFRLDLSHPSMLA